MSNLVLPSLPGMSFPVVKTPLWRTDIKEAVSGKECRVSFWSYPRWKYSVPYDILRDGALNELWSLLGFYNQHRGSWDSWLFTDPDDYTVTDENFGTGDGTTTTFQLKRTKTFAEPIFNVNGTPTIKKAGVTQTPVTHYSISSTGLVTFVTAPTVGQALTWTGSYYWRCRFMEDEIEFEKFAYQMWEAAAIEFVSVKQ